MRRSCILSNLCRLIQVPLVAVQAAVPGTGPPPPGAAATLDVSAPLPRPVLSYHPGRLRTPFGGRGSPESLAPPPRPSVVISSRRGCVLPGRWSGAQAMHYRLAPRAGGLAPVGRAVRRSPPSAPHLISEAVSGSGGARGLVRLGAPTASTEQGFRVGPTLWPWRRPRATPLRSHASAARR